MPTPKEPRQVIIRLPPDLEAALQQARREQQKSEGREITVAEMVRVLIQTHPRMQRACDAPPQETHP